jgi:hypothetical protein
MGLNDQLRSNADLSGAQLSQAKELHGFVGGLATSGVQDTSDANWANIRAQAVNARLPPSAIAEIDRIIAMPENQRAGAALPHVISNQDVLTRLHIATGGEPITINQGGAVQPGKRSLITGAVAPAGAPILMTLTPAEQHETVEMPDTRKTLPDGKPNPDYGTTKPFTKTERLEMMGFKVLPNGQVIRAGEATPGQPGPLGNGRYPTLPPALVPNAAPTPGAAPAPAAAPPAPLGGNPNAPVANPPPAAPGPGASLAGGVPVASANPGMVPTTGTPGPASPLVAGDVAAIQQGMAGARGRGIQMAAAPGGSPFDNRPISRMSPADEGLAKESGPKFQTEVDAGTAAQGQQAILANMLVDTKQFMPGPYANSIAAIRARLAPVFNVDEKALAGYDSFEKLAAQLAIQQGQSVGAGSDARFSVTQAANPHGGLSPQSIDLILRQLQGNADYIQARQSMAQQWPSKANYNGFVDSVRPLDPRVFQYERMTDGQKVDYFKAMDPKAQSAFMQAHKWAEDKKLIPGG